MDSEKLRYIMLLLDAVRLIGQDHQGQAASIIQVVLEEIREPKAQEGKL